MRCKSLVVFYEQGAEGNAKTKTMQPPPGPGGEQHQKIEARGGVVVRKIRPSQGNWGSST